MLLSGYQTAIQLAALAGFWSAFAAHSTYPDSSSLQWQIPVAVQLFPAILLLLGVFYIQESPRFLAEQGRIDEAEVALEKLRGQTKDDESIVDEVSELQDTLELAQLKKGVSFWNELRESSLRRKLAVGIGLMIAQNMVGLNALNYCK
jgi:MFS family permease